LGLKHGATTRALRDLLFYLLRTGAILRTGGDGREQAQDAWPSAFRGRVGACSRCSADASPGLAAEVARVLTAAAAGGVATRAEEMATLPPYSVAPPAVDFAPRILSSTEAAPPPKLLLPYVLLALLGVVILVLTLWLVFVRR
jgi:hypothetical protein